MFPPPALHAHYLKVAPRDADAHTLELSSGQPDLSAAESGKTRSMLKAKLFVGATVEMSVAITAEIRSGMKKCDLAPD